MEWTPSRLAESREGDSVAFNLDWQFVLVGVFLHCRGTGPLDALEQALGPKGYQLLGALLFAAMAAVLFRIARKKLEA